MSEIKICALGGLGENGKNMYCVEIDNKIFILDAGIKYPNVELFGIDSVIPDMSYIIENKEKVQGIFLSHGHEDHIGAMPQLLKKLNVSVYGTRFTMELLENTLRDAKMNIDKYKLYRINPFKEMVFGDLTVSFFNTTHSIPESIGIAIHTKDGVIVYSPDYTFNQNVGKKYKTSFDKLATLEKKGVLCLLGESVGAENIGDDGLDYKLNHTMSKAFAKANGRIIISTFSSNLVRIQQVIDLAKKFDKRVAIIGRKTQKIIDTALKFGYLNLPKKMLVNLKFIDEENKNVLNDLVILVAGDRHEPFHMIQRMAKKVDKLIHINNNDSVIMMTPPVPGTEKMAARTQDLLYRLDIPLTIISKKILTSSHASQNDIKLMINLLKPKYILPVKGEYRHQYAHKNITKELGYKDSDVVVLSNGEQVTIDNCILSNKIKEVSSGDLLVDGSLIGDINNVVLRDRELLSKDGVFMIIANINMKSRSILSSVEVVSRGFAYMKNNQELIDEVKELYLKTVKRHFNLDKVEFSKIIQDLRDVISKKLFSATRRRPIVIPVLIEVKKAR